MRQIYSSPGEILCKTFAETLANIAVVLVKKNRCLASFASLLTLILVLRSYITLRGAGKAGTSACLCGEPEDRRRGSLLGFFSGEEKR